MRWTQCRKQCWNLIQWCTWKFKRYKMCKAVNVKHLGKKIIGVYTVHYDWSALKMWFQLTHYFQYWMIMSWQDLKKNIFLVEVEKSSLGKDEHCCKIYFWYMRWYCSWINKKIILKREKSHRIVFSLYIWPIRFWLVWQLDRWPKF